MANEAKTVRRRKHWLKRGPESLQRLRLSAMVLAASAAVRVLRLTCRVRIVAGAGHVDAALARGVAVPCGWHQHIGASGLFLGELVRRGLRVGFLVSPSREGEFIARVAVRHGAEIMRGSSSRSGSEAVEATVRATRQGISPMMYADGPRGPAHVFKPGTVIVAHRAGALVMPIGCAIDRYWQIGSWDGTQIPKPFARISIAVGALRAADCDEHEISALARQVGRTVDELTELAHAAP